MPKNVLSREKGTTSSRGGFGSSKVEGAPIVPKFCLLGAGSCIMYEVAGLVAGGGTTWIRRIAFCAMVVIPRLIRTGNQSLEGDMAGVPVWGDSRSMDQITRVHKSVAKVMQENNDLRAENLRLRKQLKDSEKPGFFARLLKS